MKEYTSEQIRNVAFAGHSGSGKTLLADAILYSLKYTDRLGKVEDGSTTSDYDPEEIKRKISINSSLLPVEYKNCKINFIDNPGSRDFIGEIKGCIRASDGMLVTVDAISGSQVGTEFAMEYAAEFNQPVVFVINKMDKENANYEKAVESLKIYDKPVVPVALPIGEQAGYKGVVDLLSMKAIYDTAGKVDIQDIPADLMDAAQEARNAMIEAAAESDEQLLEKFCAEEPLTPEEIFRGLRARVVAAEICPVMPAAATLCSGVTNLLNFITQCYPSPLERKYEVYKDDKKEEVIEKELNPNGTLAAFVFKTISDPYAGRLNIFKVYSGALKSDSSFFNVIHGKEERVQNILMMRGKKQENVAQVVAGDIGALAKLNVTITGDTLTDAKNPVIIPETKLPPRTYAMAMMCESKTEEEKLGMSFHKIMEQDPTIKIHRDPNIGQTIIEGMGETHIDVAVSRLKTQANVKAIIIKEPRIPYLETITKKSEGMYRHKKQSGGKGQFGEVWLKLEPQPEGSGFAFEWAVVGGAIPTNYTSAVEKGIVESMTKGILAGYKAVDIKAICFDGKYHSVDSSDMAFKIASSMAFKQIAKTANPIILEPIYKLKVTVPQDYTGDIMGDLSSRRGRPLGQDQVANKVIITALVPRSELHTYLKDLRSMTQGRGIFEMEYDHYEQVPGNVQEKIISESKVEAEEEE